MRPASLLRVWSNEEIATLRRVYASGAVAASKVLPGRSIAAIYCMADKLGLRSSTNATWTQEESETLRRMWGWATIHNISRALKKTPKQIFWRRRALGLQATVPEGYDWITNAAERSGFSLHTFQRLMRIYRVPMLVNYGRHRKGRYNHHHIVELEAADTAIAKYLKTENIHQAAQRRDVDTRRLLNLLRLIGAPIVREGSEPRSQSRASTQDIERAIAEGEAYEWIREGARRHDVHPSSLRRWLIARGHKQLGHGVKVRKADVDATVADELAKRAAIAKPSKNSVELVQEEAAA